MPAPKEPKRKFRPGSGKTDPINGQLGAKIRDLRILAGLTQNHVAQKIGITFQQVQKYERGTNRVSVATLLRLCNALDTSASALVAELSDRPETVEALQRRSGALSGSRALLSLQSEPVRAAMIALIKAAAVAEE